MHQADLVAGMIAGSITCRQRLQRAPYLAKPAQKFAIRLGFETPGQHLSIIEVPATFLGNLGADLGPGFHQLWLPAFSTPPAKRYAKR